MNTLQEFAPELHTTPGVTQLQLSNEACSALVPFPTLQMLLSTALIRGISKALVYTLKLILLMISTLSFPLEENLTHVISVQTCRESTESSNYNCSTA